MGKECAKIQVGGIYISVASANLAARALYQKLGFIVWNGDSKKDGWLNMRRYVQPTGLNIIAKEWIELAWSESQVMQANMLQNHVQKSLSSEESRKRKLSPTASFASDVSTSVGSASAASLASSSTRSVRSCAMKL